MSRQEWDADQYSDHASFVSRLGLPVLELLDPKAGEVILDLGCGDGTLAREIHNYGSTVIGIDSSESMIQSARRKGIEAYVVAGENIAFSDKFDAVFSNASLHWMPDYSSVLNGIFKALKSPGRFVGEFGGSGNIERLREAMREIYETEGFGVYADPWFFPSPAEYSTALDDAGFSVKYIELIPRPTPLNTGIREWLIIFADHLICQLSEAQSDSFLQKVEQRVRPHLYSSSQGWVADYVRLRFEAIKA